MSEAAAPLAARPAASRALNLELRLTWELAAYAAFVVAGAGMRFWDLGSRALHHDESLHGFYAYELFRGGSFEHSPLLHGPFQFFGTAFVFLFAGGASDYTVRVLPALFGGVLIVVPFLFRDRLGRLGALFASGLIAFSPTLLYFSRFARNDIYVAVFTLGIVISLWRYLDGRRPLYLYLGAALLGLSFATKENTYINVAVLLVFLNLWLAADLARQSRRGDGDRRVSSAMGYLLYLPFAWALAALWPAIKNARQRLGLRELHPAGDLLVVLGTLSLPQLAATVQVPLESLGYELDTLDRERLAGIPTVLSLLAGSALIGLRWNWRVWLTAAAAFYIPYALLYTSFGTYPSGFGSGIWDSLDYWLEQHHVRRGDQPDFYYVMLLPAYEFLALALAGPALLYFTLRGGPRSWALTGIATLSLLAFFGADSFSSTAGQVVPPLALPVAAVALYLAVRGSAFERFLVFWAAASIVGYSWVGEKMPWLSVHTTLPVLVLAAYTLNRLLRRWPSRAGRPAPVAAFRLLAPVGAAAVFAGLALFSVRTAVVASFQHGDVPREMLVYTQTSPEVPDMVERIERVARSSGRGFALPIVVDKTYSWPWAWYLRDYDLRYEAIGDGFSPPKQAVLLVARENEDKVEPLLDRYQAPVSYRLRWWFPEVYREIGRENLWLALRDFAGSLANGGTWETWWRFLVHREHPQGTDAIYSAAVFSTAYFPRIYDPAAAPDIEGRLTIGRPGEGAGELIDPSGLAVDGAGNVYVADTGNGRIQKFGPDGRLLKAVGAPGGGRGEFNQPGDVALDGEGNVYVVDTWNHRMQKFDADLNFVAGWGKATKDLVNPGGDEMWGPRFIAVDGRGDVWVVDTGTHRIRRFSPQGKPLATLGQRGKDPGQFREPAGIAFDPTTGDALVADADNARLQRFDGKLRPVAAYPVEEWRETGPYNRPDLAALPDGRILASDPVHGRVLLLDAEGRLVAALSAVSGAPLLLPRGVAYEAASGFVYVSDGLAGNVRRFPLSDFALR